MRLLAMELHQRFEAIVAANHRRLMAIARSYARGEEGRDLYQEILLQLWRGFERFEGRSHVNTWVYRVALNTAITWKRRARPQVVRESEANQASEATVDPNPLDEIAILEEFIGSLDGIDRAVFLLYLEDLRYAEIASITGLTENHIGVKINRLKKAFLDRYVEG
jgi:RNA polymerase sigma-70 factor (ECF subfamily)